MLECKHSQTWQISNSRADNLDSSGPISSIIELIQDLMVIYILTKFGDDWLTFVDARVLTRILWMDGQVSDGRMLDRHQRRVSDHNSSLSSPCSGELKTLWVKEKMLLTYIFLLPTMFSTL